jgi:Amt family ammonium transporter
LLQSRAPCAFVDGISAFIIGLIAGLLVMRLRFLCGKQAEAGCRSAQSPFTGVNGFLGMIPLVSFADGKDGDGSTALPARVRGLFYGDATQPMRSWLRWRCCSFGALAYRCLLQDSRQDLGLRISPEAELEGLDIPRWACSPLR